MVPFSPDTGIGSAVSSPSGVRGESRRPDDLERFPGLQAVPGVYFADITFISVQFSRGRAI